MTMVKEKDIMKIDVAVIEDDLHYQTVVNKMLLKTKTNLDITYFDNAESFLDSSKNYELVLLDIDLPGMDGISLSRLIKNRTDGIVFLTSYEDKAIEAIGIKVAKYIVKTLPEEIIVARIRETIEELSLKSGIEIHTEYGEFMYLRIDDIYRIMIEGRMIYLYTKDSRFKMSSITLASVFKYFDGRLIYANQSSLVNPYHITHVFKDGTILFDNDSKEYISRNRRKGFLAEIAEQMGRI